MAKNEDVERLATELGSDVAKKVSDAILDDRLRTYHALIDTFFGNKGEKRINFSRLSDDELLATFRKIAWNELAH